ncbi:right-handed parallel beta-helix repeat-containing protein [Streptomyces niveus]|uniref:right-handed parallel beta-helix repeat-containing protein n=1 Tax=Streptomyces niveus TaxID=193462 RepID=UPI003445F7EC
MTVKLADGTYPLTKTLTLTEEDSGTEAAPVRWQAAAGAQPVIAGGRSLSPSWSTYSGQIQVATVGEDLDFDQVFINNKRQILARYPNYDPSKKLGGHASDAIAPSRVARWANPSTALVRGLHQSEWGSNSYRATGRNSNGTLAMTWVGDNQRGSGLHATYRMVENVIEELDSPGEWYYDKAAGKLYYWPATGVDLSNATVRLGELDELIRVQGTSPSSPAHDITFNGLTFTATHRTLYNSTFEPISLSDWAIVRKGAIALKNSSRISIKSSTFDHVGGNAVFMDGYAERNVVRNNVITGAGASAVAIVGSERSARQASTWGNEIRTMSDTTPGPATEDYPRRITVADNLITRLGEYEKQSAGVQIARAFRVTASHNTIHDVPRAAINIGDGTFGGHKISGNDIWNAVRETGDHGPINSWGRDRFWPIRDVTDAQRKAWSKLDHLKPTIIEHNRIWHDHDWAVDLDDGSSNYIVRNNLLLNSGTKFREGFNRTATNNIYANGSAHSHVSYADNGDTVTSNVFLTETPYKFIQADPAQSKIQYDKNVFWNNGGPVGFSPYGNSLSGWQASKGVDTGSTVADLKFTGKSPWQDPAKADWTLDATSPALSRGFVQIPMGSFGRPGSPDGPPPLIWPSKPQTATRESLPEPLLGAQITGLYSDTLASSVGLTQGQGIYLESVPDSSAAAAAGLRSADVLRKFNGTELTWKNSFWTLWNKTPAGSKIQLEVFRNQQPLTMTVTRPGGGEKINNTSGVTYTGTGWDWKEAKRGGAGSYLEDVDASITSGDSFSLTFHGTGLKMITQTNSDETAMMISVDGGPEQRVDLASPSRVFQTQVFDTGTLTAGEHTIKARSTSNAYFIVDAFEITRPSGS